MGGPWQPGRSWAEGATEEGIPGTARNGWRLGPSELQEWVCITKAQKCSFQKLHHEEARGAGHWFRKGVERTVRRRFAKEGEEGPSPEPVCP